MPSVPDNAFEPIPVHIPALNFENGKLDILINNQDRFFVVGPNGSGKSALIQYLVRSIPQDKRYRISAHRQTWLRSSAIEITPATRLELTRQLGRRDQHTHARWVDEGANERLSAVLFDLVAADNELNRRIARALQENDLEKAKATSNESISPFRRINDILRAGNISVQIEPSTGEEILAHHVEGQPFSIAKLSDGERNAVILAATVLTVKQGTVLLIDEPERHLHRSIIEPLLTALFTSRQDCPFIISTHELALPVAVPNAKVLLPRSCRWNGENVETWEIDVLESGTYLPDDLKAAVLGSRKQILFVEGSFASLDVPLYGLLFPNSTVIPKGSCAEVMRAVNGLRAAEQLHWIRAFGLVDRDDRSDDEVEQLQDGGVFALSVHSAEAIYYSSAAVGRMAERQAETLGIEAEDLLKTAEEAALDSLSDEAIMRRLCARRQERQSRHLVLSQMPTWRDIQAGIEISVDVSTKMQFEVEVDVYRGMHSARSLHGLISRYPVRESPALSKIAAKLQFQGRSKYEQAVLALASKDGGFRAELRSLLGPVAAQMNRD